MLAFSRLTWVRAATRQIGLVGEIWRVAGGFAVPLGAGVPFAARKKGFRRFYTGLSRFLYGFRDLFAGLSAFFCVTADGSLRWAVTWL